MHCVDDHYQVDGGYTRNRVNRRFDAREEAKTFFVKIRQTAAEDESALI